MITSEAKIKSLMRKMSYTKMKVKIFHNEPSLVEKEINQWLKEVKIDVFKVLQSIDNSYDSSYLIITIFYEE